LSVLLDESSEEINVQRLATELAVRRPTLESWLGLLEEAFLVARVPRTDTSVLRQSRGHKLHAVDSGLVAAYSSAVDPLGDERVRARIHEAAVFRHLRELARRVQGQVFYAHRRERGRRGRVEIDFVLLANEEAYLLEVTAAARLGDKVREVATTASSILSTAKASRPWRGRRIRGAVVHAGAQAIDDVVRCVPLTTFLETILCGPTGDPCTPLREMTTPIEP